MISMYRLGRYLPLYLMLIAGHAMALAQGGNIGDLKDRDPEFDTYWFQGKAEISSYDLEQARYGELHMGEAVLIFVTEPFSKRDQVKLDQTGTTDELTVLKLNSTRRFLTGVYPYSTMQSIFSPINLSSHPLPLKSTTSVQEWCGHSWMQFNLSHSDHPRSEYYYQGNSYFQMEGDDQRLVMGDYLEDGLWNLIRINPDALPIGDYMLIPSQLYTRFSHTPVRAQRAALSVEKTDRGTIEYHINYPEIRRHVAIEYDAEAPYPILGWTESYKASAAIQSPTLTTRATLRNREQLDYWKHNKKADRPLHDRIMKSQSASE